MMREHRSHVLSLEEMQSKNISFAKLLSLKEVPRCQTHSENISQLCCTTCGNFPICVACSFGKHKDHAIIDVISQANAERDGLAENLDRLQECKGTLEKMTAKVGGLQKQIILNGSEEKRKLQSEYEEKVKEFELKRNKLREDSSTEKTKIEASTRERISFLQENMEREIQDIKDKYDKLFENERKETESSLNMLQGKLTNEESKLDAKLDYLKRQSSYIIKLLENQKEKKLQINKEILQHFVNTTKRYDNLTCTAASIISAKHDWTAVNCIPDITAAINPVIKDANREFTELNEITNFEISGLSFVNFDMADTVTISDHPESIIDIGYVESKKFKANNITHTENGNIVVSGEISDEESHITIVSMDGTVVKQSVINSEPSYNLRFCAVLSNRKVVTIFASEEIGLFDINTGLHLTRNIKDKVACRGEDICLTGLDVDNSNNLIYVGCVTKESRLIYTFDEQLNVCHSLKLPEEVIFPMDVTHCKGNLLVCALNMKTVYRLDMEGNVLCKIQYLSGDNWGPLSVCTDKTGFIYTLWISNVPTLRPFEEYGKDDDEADDENHELTLVQYSQDGNQILAIKPLDDDICCMTIFERHHEEKLLLATYKSQKLYVFGLVS
ncbi:hypothetical protein HOLleu_38130 [Holothuria leucospilota]|uniref:B box-type domain-containing protein n=1 Tax=Holothuria leucospilota TaxID=206669 RepID=A0A9Q0YPV6_HOLLE|nr:hypothetical protein HOLleu_38130 [Holothuria leucospilota]